MRWDYLLLDIYPVFPGLRSNIIVFVVVIIIIVIIIIIITIIIVITIIIYSYL